jgi:hypothetical protein
MGLTDEQIEELMRLEAAATPGEWYADVTPNGGSGANCKSESVICTTYPEKSVVGLPRSYAHGGIAPGYRENCQFIAAARNAIPGLLAERDVMLSKIQQLEGRLVDAETTVSKIGFCDPTPHEARRRYEGKYNTDLSDVEYKVVHKNTPLLSQ